MKIQAAIILFCLFVAVGPGLADSGSGFSWLDQYVEKPYVLSPSVNANPYTYLLITEDFATLEMRGNFFPLMGPEPITVSSVELDEDEGILVFEIKNGRGEKGQMRFIAPTRSSETMGQQHVDHLLALVTEDSGMAHHVLNEPSNMLHFKGSNHCRGLATSREYEKVSAAQADGVVLCPACYSPIHLLPDYEKEMTIGRLIAGEVRNSFPAVMNDSLQTHVQEVGQRVLENWPLPLRGYEYRFTLVEAPSPNAMACPGGSVFLNRGLLDLCESDLELESILAHEIAHVEMRHGLRQLRSAEKSARIGAIAGVIAIGLGAGTDNNAAIVAGGIALAVSNTAASIALAGYSRDMEMESDAVAVNYLVHNRGQAERHHLAQVLAKLEYLGECEFGQHAGTNSLSSHPADDVRSGFAKDADVVFFDTPLSFKVQEKNGGDIEVRVFGVSHHSYYLLSRYGVYEDQTAYEFGLGEGGSSGAGGYVSETRIFVTATANGRIERGLEFKDMEMYLDGTWVKFDNKEDTELYPNTTISMALSRRQSGQVQIESLVPGKVKFSGTTVEKKDSGLGL